MPPIGFLAHTLAASGDSAALSMRLPFVSSLIYFIVLCSLFALAWIDHHTMEIPDKFHIIIAACGVLAFFFGPAIGIKSHLIGIGVASVPMFIFMVICLLTTGTEAFGFGDVKLMAAVGLFLGWQKTLVALFIGFIIGGIYGSILLATRKKSGKEYFAFGPALCIGIGIAMFAAEPIINWYLN